MTRKLRILLLVAFGALIVSACATKPKEPVVAVAVKASKYQIGPSTNIGLINIVETHATHVHTGETIFTNFKNRYEIAWNLREYIDSEVMNSIKGLGYEVKTIEVGNKMRNKLLRLVKPGFYYFHLDTDLISAVKELEEENNIDVLILIQTYEAKFINEIVREPGYGVHTATVWGSRSTYAFSHLSASVIDVKEPSLVGHYRDNPDRRWSEPLESPKDLKHISEEEINRAEPYIKDTAKELISFVIETLSDR